MLEKKIADDLNLLSNGTAIYSFDEKLNKILCINKDATGNSMTIETAYNALYEQAVMMLLVLRDVFADLKSEKTATNIGGTNGNGLKRET